MQREGKMKYCQIISVNNTSVGTGNVSYRSCRPTCVKVTSVITACPAWSQLASPIVNMISYESAESALTATAIRY